MRKLSPRFLQKTGFRTAQLRRLQTIGDDILEELYKNGILQGGQGGKSTEYLYLIKNNEARRILLENVYLIGQVDSVIQAILKSRRSGQYYSLFQELFFDIVKPNVTYDSALSQKELDYELSKIATTRGSVDEGILIVAKGEVVEAENFVILNSLKAEFQSELWSANSQYFILFGYTILVALVLMMLFLFLKKYRPSIYRNNVKVTFIFFNILLMVFLTTLVVKYNEAYVFVVPLCILPLILKTFFDARLGLFVHVLTVLILGFVVPNSFEYIFLQIIAGIVTILTVSELYKRANLFISVGQITLIYMVGYFAFHIIHEGNLDNIQWYTFGFFFLNGMITLFAQPLIYIYEKVFGMVSDVSLFGII